ncbi:MAG: dicarboxylate/amino acid:cation symporter [Bacteroidales bacterium]
MKIQNSQNNVNNQNKKMGLHWKILIGMTTGIILGFFAIKFDGGVKFLANWINPWGTLFIRLLKMIAVPLVFVSLFKGITGMKSVAKLSRIGIRTLIIYVCTTVIAITIGVTVATTVKPGELIKLNGETALAKIASEDTSEQIAATKKLQDEKGPLSFLEEIVPENIMTAAADNSKMLQIIFFTIMLGIAVISISEKSNAPFIKFMDSFYEIMLKLIDIIISFAPYGVFALMAGIMGQYAGNLSILGTLLIYFITVSSTLIILIIVFYPILIKLFTKIPPGKFIKKMFPVQLFAFSTSSSAATLPVNLKTTQKELGISQESSSFVLPVGVTINMDGTSCYQAIAVIFIAQVLGIDLSISQLLSIILLTTVSSIGTPGIPGGSYVILTMVLSAIGIPAEGLALVLAVDRPLDMLRTSVNVTGDATVSAIIDCYLKRNNNSNKAELVPTTTE